MWIDWLIYWSPIFFLFSILVFDFYCVRIYSHQFLRFLWPKTEPLVVSSGVIVYERIDANFFNSRPIRGPRVLFVTWHSYTNKRIDSWAITTTTYTTTVVRQNMSWELYYWEKQFKNISGAAVAPSPRTQNSFNSDPRTKFCTCRSGFRLDQGTNIWR